MKFKDIKVGDWAPRPPKPKAEAEITKNWHGKDDLPLVSILCHSFNHENYIEDALNGFLMQETDFPWEVIVHDDASTDKTVKILQRYVDLYPRIFKPIFQKENQYSKGLKPSIFSTKIAQGRFFAFCEGDDYWLDKRKIQTQADFLRTNPRYSVCGHDAFIFEEEKVLKLSKLSEWSKMDVSGKRLSKGWPILTLTAMFRCDYDLSPKEHEKVLNGDFFIFSRLGSIGGYKFMKELLPGAYRVHPGGIWSLVDEQQRVAHSMNSMYWISQYYKRIGNNKLSIHFAQRSALQALDGASGVSLMGLVLFFYEFVKYLTRKRIVILYRWLKGV